MKQKLAATALVMAAAMALPASLALAADDYPFKSQIEARQALMRVYAFNLGQLGAMAKGEMPYDAGQASAAANNLVALTGMDNSAMWPAGSDAGAEGLDGKTRAKGEIWSTYPEVTEKHKALVSALESLAAEAGNGLDAVRANMGAAGDGCKGCHESFRVPKD